MIPREIIIAVYDEMKVKSSETVPWAVRHNTSSFLGYPKPSVETLTNQLPLIARDAKRTMWIDVGLAVFGLGGMGLVTQYLGGDIRTLLPLILSGTVALGATMKAIVSDRHREYARSLFHDKKNIGYEIWYWRQKLQIEDFSPDTALLMAVAREDIWLGKDWYFGGNEKNIFDRTFSTIIAGLKEYTQKNTSSRVPDLTPHLATAYLSLYLEDLSTESNNYQFIMNVGSCLLDSMNSIKPNSL